MDQPSSSPDPNVGPGAFPTFADADVLIVSGIGRSWSLHSSTLRTASKKFRALFDQNAPRKITRQMREDRKMIKWKIEMIPWDDKPQDTRFRTLRVVRDKEKPTFQLHETLNNMTAVAFPKIYDNFFRCIYNLPPEMSDESDAGAHFILDAVSLLQAAESLDAAKAVRMIVEAHLLRLHQTLWSHVERNPEAWSDIAVRLQSPIIFRESMVHLVGRFEMMNGIKRDFLKSQDNGAIVLELAQRKAKELKDKKLLVERRLLDYFPKKMVHSESATDVPGRAIYATDIYLWQALTLVRQYLASSYMANLHHRAPDGGVHFYRCIGDGGNAYLRKDTLDRFHQSFGMSTKGKQCLHVAVEFIKDQLRPIVEELLADRTQINRGPNEKKPNYLTCGKILEEELPWIIKAKAAEEAEARENADRMQE